MAEVVPDAPEGGTVRIALGVQASSQTTPPPGTTGTAREQSKGKGKESAKGKK